MGEIADQPLRALEHANRVRLARADLKRQVADGELSAAEVVRTCPWAAQGMAVGTLLTSQKRWGGARSRRILLSIGVTENRPVGALTERQRMALCDALEAKAASRGQRSRGRQLTAV